MPNNYLDTPATERGDVSLAQVPALDFSIVQPFASPSKNPAEDLRTKMRGLRSGNTAPYPTRTPRVRNALMDRRNTAAVKQEFTPLLKSAKRKELVRRSIIEEKENFLSDGIPATPAAFRSSQIGEATQLPLNSSMIDGETTSDSVGLAGAIRNDNLVSSSMLSSTPMPALAKDGSGGVLDQGNVLTLRDQEAKLDQIQKDNFGLKLKIHYLEEALRKTGSEFHQATLKENAELKTERMTIDIEFKRLRKRLVALERELDEQRQRSSELTRSLQAKNPDQQLAKELAEAQRLAQARQKLADDRLEEIEDLQSRLREAEKAQGQSDDIQALQDDIEDLQREIRDRDTQLDSKDEELNTMKEKISTAQSGMAEVEHMQQDIDDLEAELKERDEELDAKTTKLAELEDRLNNVYDREKSTQKLRGDVVDLESDLRQKSQELDDAMDQLGASNRRLAAAEETKQTDLRQRDNEIDDLKAQLARTESGIASSRENQEHLRDVQRQLADKDGEIRALQERLETARGSWDAEAQQADARMQEKDRLVRDRDARLREKTLAIEQRDDELEGLQKRLRLAENRQDADSQGQSQKLQRLTQQVLDLEQTARTADRTHQAKLAEKDSLVRARENELESLQNRLTSAQQAESTSLASKTEAIQQLEVANRRLEKQMQDHVAQAALLERRADAMETPSRKDSLIKEYSEQVRSLREEMRKIEQEKDIEMDGLEQELDRVEKDNRELRQKSTSAERLQLRVDELSSDKLDLERRVDRLSEKAKDAGKDHSILERQHFEIDGQRVKITSLESQIDDLKARAVQHESSLRTELANLRQQLSREHEASRQALEDEVMLLEDEMAAMQVAVQEAETGRDDLAAQVKKLEEDARAIRHAREQETPLKQRRDLRATLSTITSERDELAARISSLESSLAIAKQTGGQSVLQERLHAAEKRMVDMQNQIEALEEELDRAREERTIADERQDLHDLVKGAKIEAEQLSLKLAERERKLAASTQRESELRAKLELAQVTAEECQASVTDLESRMHVHKKRETELRAQLKSLHEASCRIEELEIQLGDRKGSSNGHARRETELRAQLRDAKLGLETIQIELAEKEDAILALMKREHGLRERLQRARAMGDDTISLQFGELQAQLEQAEAEVLSMRKLLAERKKLGHSGDQSQHARELKGLIKQIRFLQAKCDREQRLRKDLIYTKRWFLMQVEMYNECNQADLRLLEDMGITPDQTIRETRPTLRAAGLAVIAMLRMQGMSLDWKEKRESQEALLHKLENMKRTRTIAH